MFRLLCRALLPSIPLLLALALVASGCGGGGSGEAVEAATETAPKISAQVPADAIALVGGEKVLKTEFDALLAQAEKSYEANSQDFPEPGTAEYETLKNQAVQYLVQREEFDQQAKELGITISDADVKKRLDELKQQFFLGDEARYQAQLKEQGLTEEQVLADVRAQLVSEKLFEAVTKDVQVTDQVVDTYYEENQELFTQPASRDVRHILVKKEERANELYAQLRNGADFAALAKKFSQDPGSKSQGGKLTIRKGETVPEFDKTAFELETGQLAEPVKTQFGWHIIEALSDVKPESVTPLDEVRGTIREQLQNEQRNEAMTKWVDDLKQKYETRVAYAVGYAPPPSAPAASGEAGEEGSPDTTGTVQETTTSGSE